MEELFGKIQEQFKANPDMMKQMKKKMKKNPQMMEDLLKQFTPPPVDPSTLTPKEKYDIKMKQLKSQRNGKK